MTIDVECPDCRGTGVYSGMCEAEGEAVVCVVCGGTGCKKVQYTPFTHRKQAKGIKTVRWSQGRFIAGPIGGVGDSITYKEFAEGKFPPKPKKA
jgi:hypothetical protein